MIKNKKVISKITTIVIALAIIGLVIAKLYDIAIHRPSLVYRQLSTPTIKWLNDSLYDPMSIIKAAPFGPFNWSNKDDIGQKNKKWGKAEDEKSIVYYINETNNANDQLKGWEWAQNVQKSVDDIIKELPDFLGEYKGPKSMNGRKMAIYVPSDEEKYDTLLHALCDGTPPSDFQLGRSFISVGPLGCQNEGIILHPNAFEANPAYGDSAYIRVLRRELAYYTYMANLDYDQLTKQPAWFIQGVAVHFSMDGQCAQSLSPELIQRIEECSLNEEFPTKDNLSQEGGASFIQFYEQYFGRKELINLIKATYTMPLDSALCRNDMDLITLKQMWIESLRTDSITVLTYEQNQETY